MDKSQIQEGTKKLLEKAEKPEEFTKGLQELLKSYVDRDATKNYQRIIPDTGKFFGVPIPILRVISAEIGKFIQKEPTKAPALLETIWNEASFEARQIAGKSLEKFCPKNPKVCLDFISSILPDLDNWANCDNLAMCGVEPIVYQNPELVLPLSEKWIKDKNKWIRRFGVVSLLGYKKIQITDKVFKILDIVMEDKDKDIKKAASWILREITKKNPNEVAEFLMKWAKANPSKDARWIIKDGMKKLCNNEQKKILELLD
ncbi:DNA alkylation repair protein [bacterium]|nr:DNA alkylation repair protein [bacterium]MBU4361845.1 DNA alkylation repair protein [bacterium]MCG2761694.1 DNA alkylation repair protein [Candidatus Atribacteria bacterium]MCG2820694.1 DNA alkylation repair protein [Candidatus Atribacteria bacterium]